MEAMRKYSYGDNLDAMVEKYPSKLNQSEDKLSEADREKYK